MAPLSIKRLMNSAISIRVLAVALLIGTECVFAAPGVPLASAKKDVEATAQITSESPKIVFWQRLDSVQALSKNVGLPELDQLDAFLRAEGGWGGMRPHQIWALKDELMNALQDQAAPSPEFERVLLDILQNERQDAVMRDYAVQHIRAWYPQSTSKPQLLATLWAAARGGDGSLPGTAFLSLWGIWQQFPADVNRKELGRGALAVAIDPEADIDARISCLQLCGKLGVVEALPFAVEVAEAGKPAMLRMAAIATVGDLGNRSHAPMLKAIKTEAVDQGTLEAVKAALKKTGNKS